MTGFAFMCLVIALGYPIARWWVHRYNDRADQALREMGFKVPYRKRHVGQGVPRTKQPPVPGLRGPIEGRFWGQFLP